MGTYTNLVMTLANSIIGVSVLAMPFCYKQCGIILASLMLILSSIMTRLSCYYLLKSAILARRRNFELLAFHTFGPSGKLAVELSIIGFMLGTCVAFFVVVGDLGPAILGPILNIENPASIRASVLIAIAVLVALPLGLLRNVDSLSAVSAITIAFYICLVLKVMGESTTNLLSWDWMNKVHFWRPAGLLQCIPIFSMALSCQTQLFEIFDLVPNVSLEKMNMIVRSAVNMCTLMYMAMGFFGYVAFCTKPFSGNLMLSFSPTPTSEVIKMGFVLSVAVSFPLVIFPCRASLHSLLFRRGIPPHHELLSASSHMPEVRFKCLTVAIVAVSLTTGLLIPNIELVLGLVGSTIGVMICIIVPATMFLSLTTKHNNERLLAQVLFCTGVLIMILGSYANLYATEEAIAKQEPVLEKLVAIKSPELPAVNLPLLPQEGKTKVELKDDALKEIKNVDQLAAALPKLIEKKETPPPPPAPAVEEEKPEDVRKEPPIPEAPVVKIVSDAPIKIKDSDQKLVPHTDIKKEEAPLSVSKQPTEKKENKEDIVINNDALKKEDNEIKEIQKQEILNKKEELIEKLEKNEEKQQKLLEEQKKILQDIRLEKEKLIQEGKKIENLGIVSPSEDKIAINDKPVLVSQNQIENQIGNKLKPMSDNKIIKLESSEAKLQNKITDDVAKKNMAEGLPLPLAVQHLAGIKSAKFVDNPENLNEGNVEGKVFMREILGRNGVSEQREKRDLEKENTALQFLNEADNGEKALANTENVLPEKVELKLEKTMKEFAVKEGSLNGVTIVNDQSENNMPQKEIEKPQKEIKDDPHKVSKEPLKAINMFPKEDEESQRNKNDKSLIKTEHNVKDDLILNSAGQSDTTCVDKTKATKMKFDDRLQPLNINLSKLELSSVPEEKQKINSVTEFKSGKEVINKDETSSDSIVKAPVYLSNPDLIISENKIQPNSIVLNSNVKPMKRDLKSIKSQDSKKETES